MANSNNLTSYNFTQEVDNPAALVTTINNGGLSTTLDHIDTSGSGPTMLVSIWFINPLSDSDVSTLNSIMSSYTDPVVTQNAINSILTALNTDSNVIILARARAKLVIPTLPTPTLLMVCQLLGINPNS